MGFDLKLLILHDKKELMGKICRYDQISVARGSDDFMSVFSTNANTPQVRGKELPPDSILEYQNGEEIVRIREDGYGDPLTYVFVSDLEPVVWPKDLVPKNKAIVAFIHELPEDTVIILFWE